MICLTWVVIFILQVLITPVVVHSTPLVHECSSEPSEGRHDLFFEPVWQKPAESETFMIGGLFDVVQAANGNIIIADRKMTDLKVFSSDGQYLRTIGRKGEGPGETSEVRQIFINEEGQVGILQSMPASVVWLNPQGTPAGNLSIRESEVEHSFLSTPWAARAGFEIFVWCGKMIFTGDKTERQEWISRVDGSGIMEPAIYHEPEIAQYSTGDKRDEGKEYRVWGGRWAPDGQGGIWVAPDRNQYRLENWNSGGELAQVVEREYRQIPRTDEVKRRILNVEKSHGFTDENIKIGDAAPVVSSLRLADNGQLWVSLDQGGNQPTEDTRAVIDVISQEGQWLRELHIRFNHQTSAWRFVDDRTVLVFWGDEDDVGTRIALLRASNPEIE